MGDPILNFFSFAAGFVLLFLGLLVMRAYGPSAWRGSSGSGYLAMAIFLGFAASAGNTLYWQVLGHPLVYANVISVYHLRLGGGIVDVLFKGMGAVAAYYHLLALWSSMPEKEREVWGVLEVAFYPRRRTCLRLLSSLTQKQKEKNDE